MLFQEVLSSNNHFRVLLTSVLDLLLDHSALPTKESNFNFLKNNFSTEMTTTVPCSPFDADEWDA